MEAREEAEVEAGRLCHGRAGARCSPHSVEPQVQNLRPTVTTFGGDPVEDVKRL